MNAALVTVLFFGLILFFLALGLPISFALGGVSVALTYFFWGPEGLSIIANRAWGAVANFVVVCVPLFVFMGAMLERSGVASALYKSMHLWCGRLRGGLAVGTVLICMLFAAMTGLSASATVTMGLVALPEMLKRNYDKSLALGCITAGGALGVLIPPSVTMVLYALVAEQSVGKLFMGGLVPGVILGLFFIAYILIRAAFQPQIAPGAPQEERGTWRHKLMALRAVILPSLIILGVLGTIFAGIATPTEAAAVGAMLTLVSAAIHKRLRWADVRDACYQTLKVSSMAMWIYLGSLCFTTLYYSTGAPAFVKEFLLHMPGGKWGTIITIQIIWFLLGMFLDPWGIIMITAPVFCPVIKELGFSLIWFGVLFIVNMEMAYLTPPFGFNLFYLKGVAPSDVSLADIYRSVVPFIALQALVLILVIVFPQLVLWIPKMMLG